MADATVRPAHGIEVRPWMVAGGLLLVATVLSLQKIGAALPPGLWARAFFAPDASDGQQLVIHYSLLPRILAAILAGAALALAGAVFQQVLRNPLASPTTLGVSAGRNSLWRSLHYGRPVFSPSGGNGWPWPAAPSPFPWCLPRAGTRSVAASRWSSPVWCSGSIAVRFPPALILFKEHYLTGCSSG